MCNFLIGKSGGLEDDMQEQIICDCISNLYCILQYYGIIDQFILC